MEDSKTALVEKIKTKQFKTIDESVISKEIDVVLAKNKKLAGVLDKKFNEKSADIKQIIKLVKQSLHYSYAAFQKGTNKRDAILDEIAQAKNKEELLEAHKKLLATHTSTKERLKLYDTLYDELNSVTGVPDSILDIGSGLNAASLPWMKFKKTYIASEFNRKDTEFIELYFTALRNHKSFQQQKFKTEVINLKQNPEKVHEIPVDVVFAWKVFDLLSTKEVEAVVKNCNAKYLVASFSTKTIGDRMMAKPRRTWFEMMLNRLQLKYYIREYENELFYIIRL